MIGAPMQAGGTIVGAELATSRATVERPAGVAPRWPLVALLVVAAWLASDTLAGRHPLLPLLPWLAAGGWLAVRGRRTPRGMARSRGMLALAAGIGGAQVLAGLLAGAALGLGWSPYSHAPRALVLNLAVAGGVLVAREACRWRLLGALEPRGAGRALLAGWLLLAATSVPPRAWLAPRTAEDWLVLLGAVVLPALAAQGAATVLAQRGGPSAALALLGIPLAFEWLSPVLPDLPWAVAALLGVAVPLGGLALLRAPGPAAGSVEASARPAGPDGRLVALLALAVGQLWFTSGILGVAPFVVQGTSMLPAYQTGDLLIARRVEPATLAVGDVIVFRVGSRDVVHRIVAIDDAHGRWFTTRGDNNPSNDEPVPAAAVRGLVVLRVPHAGTPAIWLSRAAGTLLALR